MVAKDPLDEVGYLDLEETNMVKETKAKPEELDEPLLRPTEVCIIRDDKAGKVVELQSCSLRVDQLLNLSQKVWKEFFPNNGIKKPAGVG